jgi:hypothetical protein
MYSPVLVSTCDKNVDSTNNGHRTLSLGHCAQGAFSAFAPHKTNHFFARPGFVVAGHRQANKASKHPSS